jgi:glycosyltransferase involved in cell wall biosynthesis
MTSASPLDLVSVVIPCYKQAQFLGYAIESVLNQTVQSHEIIVVDDGSPDETEAVATRYPTVRYVRQTNQGLSAARNTGLRHSRGAFLVFLDADDRLLPSHLRVSLKAFHRRPEAAFVCGSYRFVGDEHAIHRHDCRPQPDHYGTLLRSNFVGPPHTAMFRREAILRAGGFMPGLKSCEDQDLYLRIARTGAVYCHHEVIAEYRRHANQMSQKWEVMLSTAMAMLQSQWRHVQGRPAHEEAWHAGLSFRRRLYGPAVTWTMVTSVRSGDWPRALRCLGVLMRWYPQGLSMLISHKAARVYESAA